MVGREEALYGFCVLSAERFDLRRIDAFGDVDAGVPEGLADCFDAHTGREAEGCRAMAQVVESDVPEAVLAEELLVRFCEPIRPYRVF